jgi:two-component system cell cycle sensor histidine kinase/response regulator CckA
MDTEHRGYASSDEFHSIIATSIDGFLLIDLTGNILETNDSYCMLVGYSRDQLLGMHISEVDVTASAEVVSKRSEEIIQRGSLRFEAKHLHRDGSIIDVEISATYTPLHGGSFFSFIRDISRQKQAEKALKLSEEKYRLLFESAGDSISVIDMQAKVLAANPLACEMLGYPYDELITLRVDEIDTRPELLPELIGTIVKNGHNTFDTEHFRKDGSIIPVSVDSRLIIWDGQPAILNICRDITERKHTDELLRESEKKYRNLFNNSEIAMFRTRLDGSEVLDVNQKFLDMLEKTAEETLGKPSAILWADPKEREEMVQRLLADGRVSGYEYKMLDNKGGIKNCITSLVLYREQGILEGSILDISELKRAEEDRIDLEKQLLHAQKLESLGVLAGGIAHDFNNILMAIMGNADLALMRINKESPVVENLHAIERASARAADLAKQMLAYSGKGKFVIENLELGRIIEEMLHMLEVSISKKAVLRLNLSPNLPSVEADATQIRQIIMNLVINASEAIGDTNGFITITTSCKEYSKSRLKGFWMDGNIIEGLYVCLEISDTGCGMDEETLKRIFDPFFTTKFMGRGLGMAAVYGIVRGHKGAINVHSEPDKGTSFKILLPASGKPVEITNTDNHQLDWRGEGKVLLVDDEEIVLSIGKEMLQELGFSTVTATDGNEALEVFRSTPNISFVILDMTMPHMDGEQCFQELKQIQRDVKVIISSGFSEHEVTQKFTGKGLAGFIQKPYTLSMLIETVKKIGI